MAYIGVQPTAGQYRKLDNISASFNGSTTSFTTSVGGTNVTAGTAQQLIVSLGGVIQQPDTDYTVSTNTITFTTAPTSGLDFFAILMGDALNTVTPSDGSVTTSKLAGSLSVGLADGTVSAPSLFFTGDTNCGLYSPSDDQLAVTTNGVERVEWGTSEVVFNDGGTNYDFRVEGDTNANLLFVDASADAVGIGTSSPSAALHVVTSGAGQIRYFDGTVTGAFGSFGSGNEVFLGSGKALAFTTNGITSSETRMTIDTSGRVGIGTTSPSARLHVIGDASSLPLVLDSSAANSNSIQFRVSTNVKGYIGPAGNLGGSDNDMGYRVESGNNQVFYIGANERARLDSSGRLLVGTSSASLTNKFLLQGDTSSGNNGGYMRLQTANSIVAGTSLGSIGFGDSANNGALIEARGDVSWSPFTKGSRLEFSTTADGASSPTERMKIDNKGFLKATNSGSYFGSTSSYHEFRSNATEPALLVSNHGTSGNQFGLYIATANDQNDTARYFLTCVGGGTERATIRSNGGLANYSANNVNLSDINTKKDISPAAGTWDCIKEWEIVNYRYKDQPDDADLNLGVIAQQVAESCPEVITVFSEAKDAKPAVLDDDGNEVEPAQEAQPEKLGVKEQQMYWMAIKALQEAQVRIEQLEAKVAALESA